MTTRAAIYARTSTGDQRERQTIQQQLTDARAYCVKMGWEVADEFLDDGVSGATELADRPAASRLLEVLALPKKERPFEHLVLCYVDRLSRDNLVGAPAYNKLRRLLGGNVHFVSQSFDDTIEGQFQFGIFMAVAEYERGQIRRRTMKGIAAKVRSGESYRAANPSYGYRYNSDSKQMEIHESHAATVRRIYALYLDGKGEKRICNALTEAGVPTPAAEIEGKRSNLMGWHKSVVHRILTSRVYKGEGTFHASDPDRLTGGEVEVLAMRCPAIVDAGTWERAQAIRARHGVAGSRSLRTYMLQGLLFCGICGARYSVEVSNHGRNVYYVCSQRARYSTPGHPVVEAHAGSRHHWSAIKLESVVKAFARRFMADPSFLTSHVERRLSGLAERYNEQAGEVQSFEQMLAKKVAEEQRVLELAARGDVYTDDAQMLAALDKVRREQGALRRKLSKAQVAATSIVEIRDHLLSMRDALVRLWAIDKSAVSDVIQWSEPETDDGWRSLIRYLVDRIIVSGSGKKLNIRFEGLLVVPTPGQAAGAPDMISALGASPPRCRGSFGYTFASAARL